MANKLVECCREATRLLVAELGLELAVLAVDPLVMVALEVTTSLWYRQMAVADVCVVSLVTLVNIVV